MKTFKSYNNDPSINLEYHIEKGIPLNENVFRVGSEGYYTLFAEARKQMEEGTYIPEGIDKYLLEQTDIGRFGIYEGKHVPLDSPMMEIVAEAKMGKLLQRMNIKKGDTLQVQLNAKGPIGKTGKYDVKVKNIGKQFIIGEHPNGKTTKFRIKDGQAVGVDAYIIGKDGKYINDKDYWNSIKEEKDVELNEPKRGGAKKFYVYVKNDKGNIIKVQFGDTTGLKAKINDPEARKSFVARHNCDQKKDKTKAGYWSCRLPYYAKQLGLSGGGSFFW